MAKRKTLAEHARLVGSGLQAYVLVDLSDLDEADRKVLVEDAQAGGGVFGLQVVEEAVNGAARAPLFGYYKDTPRGDLWEKTKKDFGLEADDVDDLTVVPATGLTGVEINDPRKEAALREAAALAANQEAERIRSGEVDAIRDITGDEDGDAAATRRDRVGGTTGGDHTQNIVDPGAINADNEVGRAGPAEDADKDGNTTEASKGGKKSRNPR